MDYGYCQYCNIDYIRRPRTDEVILIDHDGWYYWALLLYVCEYNKIEKPIFAAMNVTGER